MLDLGRDFSPESELIHGAGGMLKDSFADMCKNKSKRKDPIGVSRIFMKYCFLI